MARRELAISGEKLYVQELQLIVSKRKDNTIECPCLRAPKRFRHPHFTERNLQYDCLDATNRSYPVVYSLFCNLRRDDGVLKAVAAAFFGED